MPTERKLTWYPIFINTITLAFALGAGYQLLGGRVTANENANRDLKTRMERIEEQRVSIEKSLAGMEVSLRGIQAQIDTTLRTIQRQLSRHESQP